MSVEAGVGSPDFGPALEYHSARPAYNRFAIEDLVVFAGVQDWSPVLEIGAGTGRATVPLVRQLVSVHAIDPSPDMLGVLRQTTAGRSVRSEQTTLEDGSFEPESFDLVVCAEAWHWLDPKTRYDNVRRILKPGGTLSILYNELPSDISTAIQPLTTHDPFSAQSVFGELAQRDDFYQAHHRKYQNLTVLSFAELQKLLGTMSGYRQVPALQREQVFSAITSNMEHNSDGRHVKLPYTTSL